MAITTYSELQTAIANWLNRSDLTARIPEFIALAEPDIFDSLKTLALETRADITVNARYISVPSGFSSPIRLHLDVSPIHKVEFVAVDQINDFYNSGSAKPDYYTVIGSEFEFNRTPDSSYTGKLVYIARPTALSDANTTNTFLANYPNIYMYGALLQAEPFLGNDERLQVWASMYKQFIESANEAQKKRKYQSTTLQVRSDVCNP